MTHATEEINRDSQGAVSHEQAETHETPMQHAREVGVVAPTGDSKPSFVVRIMRHRLKIIATLIVLIVLVGLAYQTHPFGIGLSKEEQAQQEVQKTLAAVGRHIIVPKDDTPLIAKVTNAATLASQQPFFANAQNGDELLVFPKTSQAILYSPSRDIIVNVGPIQYPGGAANTAAAATAAPKGAK